MRKSSSTRRIIFERKSSPKYSNPIYARNGRNEETQEQRMDEVSVQKLRKNRVHDRHATGVACFGLILSFPNTNILAAMSQKKKSCRSGYMWPLSLMAVSDVLLGTPRVSLGRFFLHKRKQGAKTQLFRVVIENNTVICLQEVHGKNEFLQAIQVWAPRFRLFGTFMPGNENAEGSATCIHEDPLPEDAVVTHVITCQGRDHIVSIQSGRQSSVVVNVHFEPELTLRRLREGLRPHHPALASVS